MSESEYIPANLSAEALNLLTWAIEEANGLMALERTLAVRGFSRFARVDDALAGAFPDVPSETLYETLALRIVYVTAHTPEDVAVVRQRCDALDAPPPEDWYAWARGEREDAALDVALQAQGLGGRHLTAKLNSICAAAWVAGRPDLVTAMNACWQEIAQAATREGGGILCALGWEQPEIEAARAHAVTDAADNAAGLILFQAARAADGEAKEEDSEEGLEQFNLTRVLTSDVPRIAWGLVGTPPQSLWTNRTEALLWGAQGQERLRVAREQRACDPAAAARRGALIWERVGSQRLLHSGSRESCADDAATAQRWLRDALRTPALAGARDRDVTGRELFVPVERELLAELIAAHRDAPHYEGLRLVRADTPPHPRQAGRPAVRYYLALTLSHRDHLHGPRRVSYLSVPDEAIDPVAADGTELPRSAHWERVLLEARAEAMGVPIVGETTWDDTDSWFGAAEASPIPGDDIAALHPDCPHLQRDWERVDVVIEQARCRRCEVILAREPAWRCPEAWDATGPTPHEWAQWWAILDGEDPATVPETLAGLRTRDGVIERHPRPTRAAAATSRESLRGMLGGRR